MERILKELEETNKNLKDKYSFVKDYNTVNKVELVDLIINKINKQDYLNVVLGWSEKQYKQMDDELDRIGIRYRRLPTDAYLFPD